MYIGIGFIHKLYHLEISAYTYIPTAVYNDSTIQYILYDKYGHLTTFKGHYNCFV